MYINKWTIDGIPFGYVKRVGTEYYELRFEREAATIEQIEGINLDAPNIQMLTGDECPLPAGKFAKTNITYNDARKTYSLIVHLKRESYGDVSAYVQELAETRDTLRESNAQVEGLNAELSEADGTVQTLYERLSESEATSAAQREQIESLSADLAEADATVEALYEQMDKED